jgi:hypothetical protein
LMSGVIGNDFMRRRIYNVCDRKHTYLLNYFFLDCH